MADSSNESYHSAASVRLQEEIDRLHLFYNEKASVIEEKLKHTFQDMYCCLTGDQQKLLTEKEQLENQLKVKEVDFALKLDTLLRKNEQLEELVQKLQKFKYTFFKELRNEKQNLETQLQEYREKLKQSEEEIEKLRCCIRKTATMEGHFNDKSSAIQPSSKKVQFLKKQPDLRNGKFEADLGTRNPALEESKNIPLRELQNEKRYSETHLREDREEVNRTEGEMEKLEWPTNDKNIELATNERNLEDKLSMIQSLAKEVQFLKTKTENLKLEKLETESKRKKLVLEINSLKATIEQLKGDSKTNKSGTTELKEQDSWKMKCLEAEAIIASLKDTCEKQDILADRMEDDNRKFRKKNSELLEKNSELQDEIQQLEMHLQLANASLEKSSKYIESLRYEVTALKKDRTELLTIQHRVKEENSLLRKEVQKLTNELNDQQRANSEFQSVLAQAEAYHEIRHKTREEILQQHIKLVDFLRSKFYDASKQKRTLADKLFRSK